MLEKPAAIPIEQLSPYLSMTVSNEAYKGGVLPRPEQTPCDIYLQEPVFRFNLIQLCVAFKGLLGIAVAVGVHSYLAITGHEETRPPAFSFSKGWRRQPSEPALIR